MQCVLFIYFCFNQPYQTLDIQSFIMEADWPLPKKKYSPLAISYGPHLTDNSQTFVNPFLGYPNCPIIGRYNRGEYKIGQTLLHIQFKCKFNKNTELYECNGKSIVLPEVMQYNIRNLPEFIMKNRPQNIKNAPDILPERYPVSDELNIIWIISFGELGKDFLNYLNHMYTLACTIMLEQKLQRKVHYLPIYAHLPERSGLMEEEVERGLNFNNYRGQYLSFHLSKGAPAFSPNNMRLGVQGGKVITSKPGQKQPKKGKKYVQKQKAETKRQEPKQTSQQEQLILDWQQMQKEIKNKGNQPEKKQPVQTQKGTAKGHQGFVHFYSSVLLESDYRVYYHWHIEDRYREDMLKQILQNSLSIEEFIQKYNNIIGVDPMSQELGRLLFQAQK